MLTTVYHFLPIFTCRSILDENGLFPCSALQVTEEQLATLFLACGQVRERTDSSICFLNEIDEDVLSSPCHTVIWWRRLRGSCKVEECLPRASLGMQDCEINSVSFVWLPCVYLVVISSSHVRDTHRRWWTAGSVGTPTRCCASPLSNSLMRVSGLSHWVLSLLGSTLSVVDY